MHVTVQTVMASDFGLRYFCFPSPRLKHDSLAYLKGKSCLSDINSSDCDSVPTHCVNTIIYKYNENVLLCKKYLLDLVSCRTLQIKV